VRKGEQNSSFEDQSPVAGVLNDGALLQGPNYLCNNGLMLLEKNLCSKGAQHPRNLDPPYPACYLPAEAFSFPAFN
jgi:hypothetical protein